MKPVNRNLADEHHHHSEEGVDAVFQRMFEALDIPQWGGYAVVFDVSENTIKTWRRRGAVSTKFLQGFAKEHGLSLDYLMYGAPEAKKDELVLNASERLLVERYRAAPKELRDAALRVLLGGEPPSGGTRKIKISGGSGHQVAGGKIINAGGKK